MNDQQQSQPAAGSMGPDHLDCAAVITEVWTLLDGECTDATRDRLRQHLQTCPECLQHYGVEERIKKLIAVTCGGDKAPADLFERVQLQISHTEISQETIRYS